MKCKHQILAVLLIAMLLFSVAMPAFAAVEDTGFADVAADAWYAGAVQYCQEQGLMGGTAEAQFSPNGDMSRAMLVTVLYRMQGSPAVEGTSSFSDVAADAWYATAVNWAQQNHVVGGYSADQFGSNDPVTREQLAAILWRSNGSPAVTADSGFSDADRISDYAVTAAAWAKAQGIINGMENNRFDPQGNATRAQVAVMLQRWQTATAVDEPTTDDSTVTTPETTTPETTTPETTTPDVTTPETTTPEAPAADSRVLVAYFSRTGNTEQVAQSVQQATGGDLFEIVPTVAYSTDYQTCLDQAQRELAADARPALSSHVSDMANYDVIYVGFPIWYGNTPMPIRSFLEEYDLTGKTIVPFSTSGSSGIGGAMSAIRQISTGATVVDGLSITSANLSNQQTLVNNWVAGLNL